MTTEQKEGSPPAPGAKQFPWKQKPQPSPPLAAGNGGTPNIEASPVMSETRTEPKFQSAIDFLQLLRPGGPWALTAIIPDGGTDTKTLFNEAEVVAFVRCYDGVRNIYFTINPTRTLITRKAARTDIAQIEYLQADLDPEGSETPEQAKDRYLTALTSHQPPANIVIDSGNGIQALWKLAKPIQLGELTVKNDKKVFDEKDQQTLEELESRSKALMLALGCRDASTFDISRIFRLPGTTNLPNKVKRKAGRVICETRLLHFNPNAVYNFEDFSAADKDSSAVEDINDEDDGDDELWRTIRDGGGRRHAKDQGSTGRSEAVWYVIQTMLRRGYGARTIVATLLNRINRISDHIYDQPKPPSYAGRQVAQAIKRASFALDKSGRAYASQNNIRIALLKLGVTLQYDRFADRTEITGLSGFGPILDDGAVDRLWLTFDTRFHFQPARHLLFAVLMDTARLNDFHPVLDYLDGLHWDGVPRIDRWLTIYGGAEDTEYTRVVGALMLVAAVRRVRQPGCKFDEMVVLENPNQGTDKSSALAILAKNENWFSDDLPLGVDGKRVIESLCGRWIVEAAELSGLRKADTEHLKGFLSRRTDRARMSYDRLVTERPRQCVIVGSTNSEEYLRDTTGNRRFWPVRVKRFDIAALARDRDQLWAEAVVREASGASIRLDPKLWPVAAGQQAQRLTADPFYETLQHELGSFAGKISGADIWTILDVRPGQRTQEQNRRIGEAIRKLGWRRPNESGMVRIGDKLVSGYVKGEHPWREVRAYRQRVDGEDQLTVCYVCQPDEDVGA